MVHDREKIVLDNVITHDTPGCVSRSMFDAGLRKHWESK